MTQAQVFNLLMAAMPMPERMRDLDMASSSEALYFTWDSIRFKINTVSLRADTVDGKLLVGDSTSQLISQLLKKQQQIENGK